MQDYRERKPTRKKRQLGLGLRRLGQKRMPWYALLVMALSVFLIFYLVLRNMEQDIKSLRVVLDQAEDLVFDKERDILRLSEQVRLAGTDQFIANEARTKYGYLFPGEIRFVVLNPEVLGLPPRANPPPQTAAP